MKLFTIQTEAGPRAAALLDDETLVDLDRVQHLDSCFGAIPLQVKDILAEGPVLMAQLSALLERVASGRHGSPESLSDARVTTPLIKARLLAPVLDPSLILSSGGAYRAHLREMDVAEAPDPVGFLKAPTAVIGPSDRIVLPPSAPSMVDWEGEFAAVIGRPCHSVWPGEALEFVAGYTLINDVSARDWVVPFLTAGGGPFAVARQSGLNIMGKQFPTFCPMGPCLLTADELDPNSVDLTTTVNGEVMQRANTSDLIFNLAETIAYFSQWYRFQPGDIITTGSPAGVGFAQSPQRFLKPGDIVEVTATGIGTLRNEVAAAPSPGL